MSEVFSRPECPFNYCDTKAPHMECLKGCHYAEGNSQEQSFCNALKTPAEVWYPCGCKASPGSPKYCPEHGQTKLPAPEGMREINNWLQLPLENVDTVVIVDAIKALRKAVEHFREAYERACDKESVSTALQVEAAPEGMGRDKMTALAMLNKWRDGSISQQKAYRTITGSGATEACTLFAECFSSLVHPTYESGTITPWNCPESHFGIVDCKSCGLTFDEQPDFPVIVPERFKAIDPNHGPSLKECNESLAKLISDVWAALEPTGEYEGEKNLVEFAKSIRVAKESAEWSLGRIPELEQQIARLKAESGRVEEQLREQLKLAKTRLEICLGRFRACNEAFCNEYEMSGHGVSIQEIPAWIEDMNTFLAAQSQPSGVRK